LLSPVGMMKVLVEVRLFVGPANKPWEVLEEAEEAAEDDVEEGSSEAEEEEEASGT
jgi:hypothetical protein